MARPRVSCRGRARTRAEELRAARRSTRPGSRTAASGPRRGSPTSSASGDRVGHRAATASRNGVVLLADDDERRAARSRASAGRSSGWSRDRARPAPPTSPPTARPTSGPGTPGSRAAPRACARTRACSSGCGRVEQLLQRVLALRRARPSAPSSMSSASKPGIGPGAVSIMTSASTRSGCVEHDPAGDHPAHRVAEQPEAVEPDRVGDRERVGDEPVEGVRRRVGRACRSRRGRGGRRRPRCGRARARRRGRRSPPSRPRSRARAAGPGRVPVTSTASPTPSSVVMRTPHASRTPRRRAPPDATGRPTSRPRRLSGHG